MSASRAVYAQPVALTVGCEAPRMVVLGELTDRWQNALSEACTALHGLSDIDQRASVVLSGDEAILTIDVTTGNGREATRRARDPQALRDTLEALLAVPTPPTSTIADTTPVATPPAPPVADVRHHEVVPTAGVGMSGRIASHNRHALGPAAFAGVHIDDWFVGGSLRWDALEDRGPNTASGYEMNAIAGGITLGRRITHGNVDCDVAFEPRLIAESQSHHTATAERGTTTADFWFAGLVRAAFGPWRTRPYVQADVELAPSRFRREFADERDQIFKPLPSWSVGLALGIAWDVR